MTPAELMPFEEAMRSLAARGVLPTSLTSAELRQLGAGFHRQNFTSAQTLITDLLDAYKEKIGRILNPQTVEREDGSLKTEGLDPATARLQVKQLQESLGMVKGDGSITDLTSDRRINLVIQTNRDIAQGAGQFVQSQDERVIVAFPAWELFRLSDPRGARRNWAGRWQIAAQAAGDADALRVFAETGRMMARKDSPVWEQIGSSENFDDALDNPFPPFAFNSGMDVRDIAYSEAVAIGLIQPGDVITPLIPDDLANLFGKAA